jgi:gamma-glutamylaminecyclotransferase
MNKIFVYGTLKQHQSNFDVIRSGKSPLFCGEGLLDKSYGFRMISMGAFPAIIPCDESLAQDIIGEMWKVDKNTFKNVDYLEGHPNFYIRDEFDIVDFDGDKHNCWVYFLKSPLSMTIDNAPSVNNGVWLGREDSLYGVVSG